MIKNKSNTKSNVKKTDIDSSDISSYDENEDYENMTSEQISQKGKEKFFKTELMEKIVKYIKIDDSIKEKQKEIRQQVKCLKTQKSDMEKYIIAYLENINEEFVNIEGTAKLTKTVSTSKGAIKPDNIKTSVIDSIKKQNIKIDENKINNLLEDVLVFVDKNRPTKTKTYIKRTKGATNKALRKIAKDNEKENNSESEEDELPKYSSDKNKKK
jgi:hypothetical protein